MSIPLPPLLLDSATSHPPAAYAEVVDQLTHTVQQLLLAALLRVRQQPEADAPAVLEPPLGWGATAARLPLSSREREVLQRIAAGESNKAIARALALSPHTVKRHVANILDKLDLRSRGQAAAWWLTRQQRPLGH